MFDLSRRFILAVLAVVALSAPGAWAAVGEVQIKEIAEGAGAVAEPGDKVDVHYTGWFLSGEKFDSSRGSRPLPFVIGEGNVIPGWEIGVAGMKVGGKRELLIPPELAYGEEGFPGAIPPNSPLKFEVELVSIKKAPWTNVDADGLKALLAEGVTLVDIRRADEWAQTGVIEGSKLITLFDKVGRPDPDFITKITQAAPPGAKVALICRTGNRTLAAAKFLTGRLHYQQVYNVRDGITDWKAKGHPTVKPN